MPFSLPVPLLEGEILEGGTGLLSPCADSGRPGLGQRAVINNNNTGFESFSGKKYPHSRLNVTVSSAAVAGRGRGQEG